MGIKKIFAPQEWDNDVPMDTHGEILTQSISRKKLKNKKIKSAKNDSENTSDPLETIHTKDNDVFAVSISKKSKKKKSKMSKIMHENGEANNVNKIDVDISETNNSIKKKKKKDKSKNESAISDVSNTVDSQRKSEEFDGNSKKKKKRSIQNDVENGFNNERGENFDIETPQNSNLKTKKRKKSADIENNIENITNDGQIKKAKKRKGDFVDDIPKKSKKFDDNTNTLNNETKPLSKNARKKLKKKLLASQQSSISNKIDIENKNCVVQNVTLTKNDEPIAIKTQNSEEVSQKTLKNRKRRAKKKVKQTDAEESIDNSDKKIEDSPKIEKQKVNKQKVNKDSKTNQSNTKENKLIGIAKKSKEKDIKKFKALLENVVLPKVDKSDDLDDKTEDIAILNKLDNEPEEKPVIRQLSLRERMMEKLKGARFRYLNEQMYKKESREANKMFREDPTSFKAYHEGYKQQVGKWPLNPLDIIISDISKMSKNYVIADLGCGEAHLAKSVPQKVHSFDLVALNSSVTACDMSHTPLLTGHVDVVVFCLSLMGTNLKDYILEANRILKIGGMLKIAEVESRFENIDNFIGDIKKYGFSLIKKDLNNQLFYFMDFKKDNDVIKRNKVPEVILNPCLYKKR